MSARTRTDAEKRTLTTFLMPHEGSEKGTLLFELRGKRGSPRFVYGMTHVGAQGGDARDFYFLSDNMAEARAHASGICRDDGRSLVKVWRVWT